MVRVIGAQMLPWFGKRDRMAAVADREADAVAARADLTVLDVVTAGKRAYYDLVLNRQARAINREQRAIVDTVVEVAIGRLRSGTGMHHDVLKMQTEATMLDDGLVMLDADRRRDGGDGECAPRSPRRDTRRRAGGHLDARRPVSIATRLVEAAIAHRPELREMVSMEAAERAMAEAARREYYPDVMVGALYDFKIDAPDTMGAMLGLNIPIWIGSKQRLDVQAAETRARAVERERAAMAAMVRAEIERQLARVDAAERRVRLLDTEFIPRAQQTFDSAIRAFPSGYGRRPVAARLAAHARDSEAESDGRCRSSGRPLSSISNAPSACRSRRSLDETSSDRVAGHRRIDRVWESEDRGGGARASGGSAGHGRARRARPGRDGGWGQRRARRVCLDMPASTVDPARQQLLGIKTAPVERQTIERTIRTVGLVQTDETRTSHVHVKFEGFIEQIYVNYIGRMVQKGQPLFKIYSRDLLAAEQEYLSSRAALARDPGRQPAQPCATLRNELVAASRAAPRAIRRPAVRSAQRSSARATRSDRSRSFRRRRGRRREAGARGTRGDAHDAPLSSSPICRASGCSPTSTSATWPR